MSKAGLRRILTEPVNSIINQVTSLLASEDYGVKVEFTPLALDLIADKAFESKTGARSLRKIVDEVLNPTFKNADRLSGETVIITPELIELLIPKFSPPINESLSHLYI